MFAEPVPRKLDCSPVVAYNGLPRPSKISPNFAILAIVFAIFSKYANIIFPLNEGTARL